MRTFLEQEIASQPETAAALLESSANEINDLVRRLPAFDHILIAARGSSRHAGIYAQYVLGALTGISVGFVPASLHTLYAAKPKWQQALIVAISQGGASPDILHVIETARYLGRPTVAITNDTTSSLAATAEHVIDIHAGPERSLAATKSYIGQMTTVALIAAALAENDELHRDIQRIPGHLAAQLTAASGAFQLAADTAHTHAWTLLGRGYNHATAAEGALKLTELAYAHAIGWSVADYLHGPIAAADDRTHVIVISADDPPTHSSLQRATSQLAARGTDVTAISPTTVSGARTTLPLIQGMPAWLSPICAIIPLQQLALAAAEVRGHDLDNPRGLTKTIKTT